MKTKSIFKSKTFWTQNIILAATMFPQVRAYIGDNGALAIQLLSGVNIALRYISKGAVTLFPDKD
jgi:hypothetical protein